MSAEQKAKGLIAKMAEVQAAVGHVPKNGWNDHGKYKYATEADILEAVRHQLSERGVAVFVSSETTDRWTTPKGNSAVTDVRLTMTFVDGETGETHTIHSCGSGADTSDKGVYKAITGAQKYALMKTFLMPTGDDPEASDEHGQAAGSAAPVQRPQAVPPPATSASQGEPGDDPGSEVWQRGKHKGKTLASTELSYLEWFSDKCMPDDPSDKWYEKNVAFYNKVVEVLMRRKAEGEAA